MMRVNFRNLLSPRTSFEQKLCETTLKCCFHRIFFKWQKNLCFSLSLLDALVVVPVAELVLFVTDEVVGVDDGFTEGEA